MIIKVLYPLYFAILTTLIINIVSEFLFSKARIKIRSKVFVKKILLAFFFPFLLFSSQGRSKLLTLIK